MVLVLVLGSNVDSQTIAVKGTVLDSASSAPIPGASVYLIEYPELKTATAGDGSFLLSGTVTGIRFPATRTNRAVLKITGNEMVLDASGRFLSPDFRYESGFAWIGLQTESEESRFEVIRAGHGNSFAPVRSRPSAMAKPSATVTLRVAAPDYMARNFPLTGVAIDVGALKLVKSDEVTGVWSKVTPAGADLGTFGLGFVVVDPARPNSIYCAGGNGLYRSSDYGKTFSKINKSAGTYSIAIANPGPGTEPTLWVPSGLNNGTVLKSIDGGMNWRTTGGGLPTDLYSIQVDPDDNAHLLSGLHEMNGIVESTDGGETWKFVGTTSGMAGGLSWFPFFIKTGLAATSRTRWLAVPQQGSTGTWLTTDGGKDWAKVLPNDHPHGNCQIHQADGIVYLAVESLWGTVYSPGGVYRSSDSGLTWINVTGATDEAVVWGTAKRLYSMYGWAAGGLGDFSPNFRVASQPGTGTWTTVATPGEMTQGPSSMAVTYDGMHAVFVGSMWLAGLWRYVEP
jgi:photosystem II stability/assembly factor-like uncharacterized protein